MAHYTEIATQKDVLNQPEPDWGMYVAQEEAGNLILVVARDPFGIIQGYCVLLLQQHPHYASVRVASDDLHYLEPRYRGVGTGKDMLYFAEKCAREAGASMMKLRLKAEKRPEDGKIFESMGYELTDLVYTKDIRDVGASQE